MSANKPVAIKKEQVFSKMLDDVTLIKDPTLKQASYLKPEPEKSIASGAGNSFEVVDAVSQKLTSPGLSGVKMDSQLSDLSTSVKSKNVND